MSKRMDQARVSVTSAFHTFMKTQGLLDAAPSFAVALSGGTDSLCLALITHEWTKEYGGQVFALTVDHGLRPESAEEAKQVNAWMKARSIPHETLVWEGVKPTTGLQSQARKIRYDLLLKICKDRGIPYLLLGHHQQDQHETFFMRLASGSGSDGLAGMAPVSKRDGITLLRPFLTVAPNELKAYLKEQNQGWIEDPSNTNENSTRVRFRNLLKEEGLSPDRLNRSLTNFQEDREHFRAEVQSWCLQYVTGESPLYLHIASLEDLLGLHPALGKRVLRQVIQRVNCYDYGLGPRQLMDLWATLQQPSFSATTLGGCYLLKRKHGLHIQRELRAIEGDISYNELTQLWDGRIDLSHLTHNGSSIIRPLGPDLVSQLKQDIDSSIPTVVWPTLPSVWEDGRLLSVPHLEE